MPSRLFIVGGGEILSSEGTIQGKPIVMGAHTLSILPLIKFLLELINLKEAVFADNYFVAASLNSINDYPEKLTAIDPKCGSFPKPTKSYLIMKEKN